MLLRRFSLLASLPLFQTSWEVLLLSVGSCLWFFFILLVSFSYWVLVPLSGSCSEVLHFTDFFAWLFLILLGSKLFWVLVHLCLISLLMFLGSFLIESWFLLIHLPLALVEFLLLSLESIPDSSLSCLVLEPLSGSSCSSFGSPFYYWFLLVVPLQTLRGRFSFWVLIPLSGSFQKTSSVVLG